MPLPRAFARVLKQARKLNWNVYAKPPFNGPAAVIRYLSRYTHRIAISDARILSLDDDTVTFRCRKPTAKVGDRPSYGTMTLSVDQFIRRFLMHRIPPGFHRMRQTLQARPDHPKKPHRPGGGQGNGDHPKTRPSPSSRNDMKTTPESMQHIQRPRDRHGPARARRAEPTQTTRNVAVSGPDTTTGDWPAAPFGTCGPRRSPASNGINRPG